MSQEQRKNGIFLHRADQVHPQPRDIWVWGIMKEVTLMGALARGWVSSAEILTCCCQPSPTTVTFTHSSCTDFGGQEATVAIAF